MSHWNRWIGPLAILALAACGGDDQQEIGRVRTVHLSPDAGTLQVAVDGNVAITGLIYPGATPYFETNAGTRTIQLEPNGGGTPWLDTTITIAAGQDRTTFAVDDAADMVGVETIDDNSAPAAGRVRLRVIHAIPDASPVDVYLLSAPDAPLGAPVVTGLAFKAVSPYLDIAGGTYTVVATLAGTSTVVISEPRQLFGGSVVTLAAREGSVGGVDPIGWALFTDRTP